MAVIETECLTKYYGGFCAVDSVDLEVEEGEVFGLLGPNGAGKSTVVMMLTTLLRPTRGRAWVCGFDIRKEQGRVREKISYVPQYMAVDIKLTGWENVELYAKLYNVKDRKSRIQEVLELLDLDGWAGERVDSYSGGMRRRLELAQALVHRPQLLFLDEPTLGLDVAARKKIWKHIQDLQEEGMTVFMTTHYMEEADEFCDRIAIIDHGKIITTDSPRKLKNQLHQDIVTVKIRPPAQIDLLQIEIPGVKLLEATNGELRFLAGSGDEVIPQIAQALQQAGVKIHSINLRQPSLDDVFLQQTKSTGDESKFDYRSFRVMLRMRK